MTITTRENLYSFEEYCTYDDGTDYRYELVDGKLEIMNPPTFRHLLIAKFLEQKFDQEIKRLNLPWLCLREGGIRTGWRKSRISDIYIIPKEQVKEFLEQPAIAQIPPLLVVEVVSTDSVKRDYRYKRSEYAALAIPEYWIVDPLENKISILQFNEGLYEETSLTNNDQISSQTFTELSLTVDEILKAGQL